MRLMASLLSGLLAIGATAPATAGEVVTLRADIWCPYNCAPGSTQRGYMVDIASRVFEAAGHRIDYRLVNWSRAIRLAEQGEIDGIIGATRDEVPSFVFPDEPLGWSRDAYFVNASDPWRFEGPSSLAGKRIGLVQDYDYTEILATLPVSARVEYATGDQPLLVNLRKLTAGRIDILVSDENVAKLTLRDLSNAPEIRLAGREPARDRDTLYIAFSPARASSRRYARMMSDAVQTMRRSGELAVLLKRYGLTDWENDGEKTVSMHEHTQ